MRHGPQDGPRDEAVSLGIRSPLPGSRIGRRQSGGFLAGGPASTVWAASWPVDRGRDVRRAAESPVKAPQLLRLGEDFVAGLIRDYDGGLGGHP